jgi:PAS domain S-box-containing protein
MFDKWLTFGLGAEEEDRFRQAGFSADIAQARTCIWLILPFLAAFAINDYGFFGLTWRFYGLQAARLALIIYTLLLLKSMRGMKSYVAYDRAEFVWGLFVALFTVAIAATRPHTFIAHTIVVVIAVFLSLLAVPNRFVNQLIVSLVYTVGETLVIAPNLKTAPQASVTALFSMFIANSIAVACARQFNTWRRREFLAREEGKKAHAEAENQLAERMLAEEALRESERRLVGVLESMPDAFVSFDHNLRYTYVNRNAERLQGGRREELLGRDVREVYPDPESYKTISLYERVMTEGSPVTATSYHAGFDQWVEVRVFPTPDGVSVFYKDVSDKVKAEEALRESEERLRLLGDNLPESAVYQYTHEPDGSPCFLHFSAGMERLNGVTVGEVLADAGALHRQIPAEYIERLVEAEAKSKRELSDFDMEVPMRRPDGEVRWMRLHSRPRRMPGGRVIWDGVQTDVTERRLAEEALQEAYVEMSKLMEERTRELHEKEVLLKEVHHRVKNNLQVISSLVSLEADGSTDGTVREVLRDVTCRVRSMALVHEKLYQSESLSRVDFAEYSRGLLGYLWRAHGAAAASVKLNLKLSPVSLPVDTAVPCGLILNELAGNALKHAFRGRSEGEVTVSLKGGEDGRISLCVTDNGIGFPAGLDWRKATSLGLRLVQMLSGQIGGEVKVSGGEGTRFEVSFGL